MNPELLSGKKILWLEDDTFLSEIITKKLAEKNAILIYAKSGIEALAKIEDTSPDVIVLDVVMVNLDGYDVLKKIKEIPQFKDIPVILLTNLDQEDGIEKGMKLGAAKFLIKAKYTLDQIFEEIEKVLMNQNQTPNSVIPDGGLPQVRSR